MSKAEYHTSFIAHRNVDYKFVNENTPDVSIKTYDGTWPINTSKTHINWVDNETIQIYVTDDLDQVWDPWQIISILSTNGITLSYSLVEETPLTAEEYNKEYITIMKTYKLNWKLTYLQHFINDNKNALNEYVFKRSNAFPWHPAINTPCPIIKKYMEDKQNPTVYVQTKLTSQSWQIQRGNAFSYLIPTIQYYIFTENGKFWLFPLLDGAISWQPGFGGVDVKYIKRNGQIITLDNDSNKVRWGNIAQHLNSYASQLATSGFVGKFFGPSFAFIKPPENVDENIWFKTSEGGPFIKKNYGNDNFYGLKFRNDLWNQVGYAFDIWKTVNVGQVIDPKDRRYNFEHLRYIDLGFYKNIFDLPTLYWCQYGSVNTGSKYTSNIINCRCIDAQIKADGIYITLTNNGGVDNYLKYITPEISTFHLSNQLPVPVNTYLTWSNNNATAIRANFTSKQLTTAITGVTTALVSILGAILAPVSGGMSAILAAGAGAAIGGMTASLTANTINHVSTFEQAKEKYKGNIISGDGVDFAFSNYYMKHTDDNQGSTIGKLIKDPYVQVYSITRMDESNIDFINNIIYYFGYNGTRIRTTKLFEQISNIPFTYHQFDVEKSPKLQELISEFTKKVPSWANHNDIYDYIAKKLESGVRWWW